MGTTQEAAKLLAVRDVADRLAVSVRAVRQLIGRGDLPATRLSERRLRVPEAALVEYVARRTVGGNG